MKNSKGYTLIGTLIVVSVLTAGAISTINKLVSGGKIAKDITDSEARYSVDRADSILVSIRDSRGR